MATEQSHRIHGIIRNLSHAANDLFWFILPLVLPLLLQRFDISYAAAGGILTYYLAVNAVCTYIMGRISDRIPRRLVIGIGFFVAAAGLILAAFAPDYRLFLAALTLTAFGVSTFHPAMYAHIDETGGDDKGRILGLYEATGTAAILVMFLVNGALISRIGAPGVMIITTVPALVMGALVLSTRRFDAPGSRVQEQTGPAGDGHPPMTMFLLFLATIVFRVASVMGVVNFLPTIFTHHFGSSMTVAAYSSGLFFAGGILGSVIASRYSRTAVSYRVLIIGSMLITPLVASLAVNLPFGVRLLSVFLLGALGSGLIINQNIILTTLGSRFGRGEAFGILMAVMTLSQSVSPGMFGLGAESWGFSATLLVFSLPVLLSMLLLVVFRSRMLRVIRG